MFHDERIRLTADFYNYLAGVALATGAIIPMVWLSLVGRTADWTTFSPLALGIVLSLAFRAWALIELRRLKRHASLIPESYRT